MLFCLTGSHKVKPQHTVRVKCDVLCVYVLDVEEIGVFVSRTLVVVQPAIYWPVTVTIWPVPVNHFSQKCLTPVVLFVFDASDLCVQLCNTRFYIFCILHWVLVSSVQQQKREGPCLQPLEDEEEEDDLDDTIPGTPPAKKVASFVSFFQICVTYTYKPKWYIVP